MGGDGSDGFSRPSSLKYPARGTASTHILACSSDEVFYRGTLQKVLFPLWPTVFHVLYIHQLLICDLVLLFFQTTDKETEA